MKPQQKELLQIEHQYSSMLANLVELLDEYREAFMATVVTSEVVFVTDFRELTRDAFIYKLGDIYQVNKSKHIDGMLKDKRAMEALLADVDSILDRDNKI